MSFVTIHCSALCPWLTRAAQVLRRQKWANWRHDFLEKNRTPRPSLATTSPNIPDSYFSQDNIQTRGLDALHERPHAGSRLNSLDVEYASLPRRELSRITYSTTFNNVILHTPKPPFHSTADTMHQFDVCTPRGE